MTDILDRVSTLQKKAAGEVHTGAMIALIPAVDDAHALELGTDGGEHWDELHVTLTFLGKAADISETAKMFIVKGVQDLADRISAFDGRSFAVNVFNPNGDEPCLVLGVGGNELDPIHDAVGNLLNTMDEHVPGFQYAENHKPWIPHLTLTYFKDKNIDWSLVERVAKNLPDTIRFDRIRIAFAGSNLDFPLRPTPSIEDTNDAPEIKPTTAYEKAAKPLGKCRYCKDKATVKIGIDGGAWIGTCKADEERGRREADGPDDEDMEEKAVRHVRTAGGVRKYKQPIGSVIIADGRSLPHLKVTGDSDYEGWVKAKGTDGKDYEVGQEEGKWYATGAGGWDEIIAEGSSEEDVYKKLDAHIGGGKTSTPKKPEPKPVPKTGTSTGGPGFKKVESEYDGYDQYEGDNGKTLWSYKEGNQHVIVDEDNNTIETVGRNELLGALNRLLKKDDSEPKKPEPEPAPKTSAVKKPARPYADAEEAIKAAQEDPAAFVKAMAAWLFPIGSGVEAGERKRNAYNRSQLDGVVDRINAGADHETAAYDIRQWARLGGTIERGRLNQIAKGLEEAAARETNRPKPNSNGSKVGPGGQGHVPEDPDKVVLTKPKDLDSGMMVNIGEGGWKYIGTVVKVTRTNGWGRGGVGSLEGQYKILDPWGEWIATMSPNHTVEVDTNVPKRSDMRPKMARKPYPSRDVYFEPAPGVAGQQNPFEDGYPDFDSSSQKIFGKPIRYEHRVSPGRIEIVKRERGKDGKWTENVVSSYNYPQKTDSNVQERYEIDRRSWKEFQDILSAERAKAGVSNWKRWSVPPQKRASKAKPANDSTATSSPPRPSGGLATHYEAMKPTNIWTEEKRTNILNALRSTEEGRVLAETLDRFQDGGSIARLRTAIEKHANGEPVNATTAARVEALRNYISNAPSDWAPSTLYRGMSVPGSFETVMGKYKPGQSIDLNLTSFSSDRLVARRFQQMTAKPGTTRVTVVFTGDGKKVLPIQNLARDRRLFKEKEWISAGRYRVSEVKKSPDGSVLVYITQESAL